jgi:hypothetical protein
MTKTRWYTPQLEREVIRRLYFRAKAEQVAMTTVLNRIVRRALDAEEAAELATCKKENPAGCSTPQNLQRAI